MMKQKKGSYVLNVEFVKKKEGGGWEAMGKEVITIDSGAEESGCPLGWGESFGLEPVKPGKELKMINAGGGAMQHYGSRKVQFGTVGF